MVDARPNSTALERWRRRMRKRNCVVCGAEATMRNADFDRNDGTFVREFECVNGHEFVFRYGRDDDEEAADD